METVTEIFGSLVFNDKVMKERLPADAYSALKLTQNKGEKPSRELTNVIADVMKEWAIEKGATHYTHWFQPMTGITAEKHDSFIAPGPDGTVIMKFSGKELIKGESDASSFPSGGLRSTFEARGYTVWDTSSYAFIKDGTLCIPTAFISYSGQVLDKKTPLLRSMNVLINQVKRFVKLFGSNSEKINITVGAEQEYFLITKELFDKRKDLITTGRTLLGARPPKGQELENHYYGNIKPRIIAYMEELDRELWKLGIYAKTRHNEAAPAQHELAPIFTSVNVSTDQNQLTMEIMQKVAERHGLVCLLHEKPFAGVNGSGKHNNWSVSTETENLLDPGKMPETNLRFLLFLAAIIKAVDVHQDLLRLSVATAGNDHRLGSHEAPPAIISVFLGSELTDIFESMAGDTQYLKKESSRMKLGVESIPEFMRDSFDRNRTSPFAFTGNKFEFRMLGSSINISCPNTLLNTSVADALKDICDELEGSINFEADVKKVITKIYKQHSRIIFNGNNYSEEWHAEAKKRGLLNLRHTPEALSLYNKPENIEMFARHSVYTKEEIEARQEILLENYCKIINIEALTMISIVTKEILPSVFRYMNELSDNILKKKKLSIASPTETQILKKTAALVDTAYESKCKLEDALVSARGITPVKDCAVNFHDSVFLTMQELRTACDQLETIVSKKHWPFPTYSDLLYSI